MAGIRCHLQQQSVTAPEENCGFLFFPKVPKTDQLSAELCCGLSFVEIRPHQTGGPIERLLVAALVLCNFMQQSLTDPATAVVVSGAAPAQHVAFPPEGSLYASGL